MIVGEEGVCAVLEKEVHDVVVAALRSPEDRRCDGVAASSVDVGAGLDEKVAESVVIVDRRPLRQLSVSWSQHEIQ